MPITDRPTDYGDPEFGRFLRLTFSGLHGWSTEDLASRPLIGICNTESEVNRCHAHFGTLVEAIKAGVIAAGGIPLTFPTISIGEVFVHPTSMLLRNLAAMDTEMMIKAQPLDGVVLLGACDKTIPAQLMGLASANVPALVVSGGPMANGSYGGKTLGACSDCRSYWQDFRAGAITAEELGKVGQELTPGVGHCMVMGTASTMAVVTEAIGMMLSGGAAIPASHQARRQHAFASGRAIVRLATGHVRPRDLLTGSALHNGVVALLAVGGSTNAIIHLLALAGRLDVPLTLDDIDRLSRQVPILANLRPVGQYQVEDFYRAGGVPALLRELTDLLDVSASTVDGEPLGALLTDRRPTGSADVIRARSHPVHPSGGVTVLRGNLAPRGAVIKDKAATGSLLEHTGPALVFESLADLEDRLDDPALPVTPGSVLVLRNVGPVGAPGMPEAGSFPIPRKLLGQGIRDVVRLSDARMSGTAGGTVVLHIAPEAYVGGPLGLVQDGDLIELSVKQRKLNLLVASTELERRAETWSPPAIERPARGYEWLYVNHVTQADEGCDFDFLRGRHADANQGAEMPPMKGRSG